MFNKKVDRASFFKLSAGFTMGAVGVLAAGCGTNSAASVSSTGDFIFVSSQELDATNWNPFSNTQLSNDVLNPQMYDYLVNRDNTGRIVPGLATHWRLVTPNEWEFDLRSGVKFHDGQPLTATDVKASLEYASGPKAVTSFFWGGVTPEVEIVNPHRVRIHTSVPYGGLITGTMSGGKGDIIVSHKDLEAGVLSTKVNGTGPFRFVGYGGDQSGVHLEPNQTYWGGAPGLRHFYFRGVADSNVRLAALVSGQVDVIERVDPDQVSYLKGKGMEIQRTPSVENKWLAFRCNKPPFNNKTLRQAVCYAIDTETIVNKVMLGSGTVLKSYLAEPQEYYAPYAGYFRYDPAKAKQLLSDAGYPGGRGLPEIEYITSTGLYPKTQDYGQFIVQNLQAIGMNVKLTVMESAAWNNALMNGAAGHMIDHGWFVAMTDPQVVLYSLFSEQLMSLGKNVAIQRAIAEQTAAVNPQDRGRILNEKVVPLLVEEATSFPVFTSQLITAMKKDVKNFYMPPIDEFRARYVAV